jgi:hypothetical protein
MRGRKITRQKTKKAMPSPTRDLNNNAQEKIGVEEFISEAKLLQKEIRIGKVAKLDPLKVKHIWNAGALESDAAE